MLNHILDLLHKPVAGRPLWHYTLASGWIVISFLAAPVTGWLLRRLNKRIAAQFGTGLADKIHVIIRMPLRIAAVLALLTFGVRGVDAALVIALAIAGLRTALRLVDLLFEHTGAKIFHGDPQLAAVMLPVLAKVLKVFIVIIGGLTAAQCLGLPVTSVIAGLGIGGIAVALAAQNTLANFFGSLVILADRPFRIGDVVRIDSVEGKVESIGLRSTRIRMATGDLVTIPNKNIADSVVVNRTPKS